MENPIRLNRRRWAAQFALTTGLALLFLAALLWGLQGVTPARADPGTLYVDGATGSDDSDCSNPADPCATIGYALTQAGNGDEIRVAEGTYTETLDIAITVALKGSYTISGTLWLPHTGETVVDADGADDSVISVTPENNVTVEGLTIQGANHISGEGGGFFINGATVVISDTVVQDNTAGTLGGGVYVEEVHGAATVSLISSELLNNEAGEGGGLFGSGLITLDDAKVVSNTAQGGGGGLQAGRVTITNSAIVSNTAGAPGGGIFANVAHIYNSEISGNEAVNEGGGVRVLSRLLIQDCMVSNNRVVGEETDGGGISAHMAESTTIVNTVIKGNSATNWGVGLYMPNTVFTVTNSLFFNNTGGSILDGSQMTGTIVNVTVADNTGVGVWVGGAVTVTNSIMWGHGESDDYRCDDGCTLAYSDVGSGDTTGPGNISADPLFVGATNGDYHLQVGSPCIDKGTSAGAPTHDIEGTPRDAVPDMGAYEWVGFRIFLPLTLSNVGP